MSTLKVQQENCSISVTNTAAVLAGSDQDLEAAFVMGSSLVTISAVNPPAQVQWALASEDGPAPAPIVAGPQITFLPNVAGNYLLTARDGGGAVLNAFRFAIVAVNVQPGSIFRTGERFLETGEPQAPVSGMFLSAVCVLQSGNIHPLIGTGLVVIGNVGNLQSDTFQVSYPPDGLGTANPGQPLPLLDTRRGPKGNGSDPFRNTSCMKPVPSSAPGLTVNITSNDAPQFWWASHHPVTGQPFGPKSGEYTFMEYLVAYSLNFQMVHTPLTKLQYPWIATPCVGGTATIGPITAVPQGVKPQLRPPLFNVTSMTFSPPGTANLDTCCQGGGQQDGPAMDFALGETVGNALFAGCDVVYAELLTGAPEHPGTAPSRILEAREGVFTRGELFEIPYAPEARSSGALRRLAHSWIRTTFVRGARVMAVLTRRRMGDLGPGDPVVVTSRTSDFEKLEKLVAIHKKSVLMRLDPQSTFDAFDGEDAALAGYTYAALRHVGAGIDTVTDLRFRAIGSPGLPPQAWPEVADGIVPLFSLLAEDSQHSVIRRFSECARSESFYIGSAGFRGLGQIVRFAPKGISDPSLTTGLADAYRRLIAQGMAREVALEAALSINLKI
jgi:hypothetical protein